MCQFHFISEEICCCIKCFPRQKPLIEAAMSRIGFFKKLENDTRASSGSHFSDSQCNGEGGLGRDG